MRVGLAAGFRLSLVLIVPGLLLMAGCGGREGGALGSHRFQAGTEDGIPVSLSSGGPKYQEGFLVFEELVRLEQDESRPETLLFRAGEMLAGEDGQFYIFDQGNSRIAVFGEDGRFRRSFGRSGEGPGEFLSLSSLWLREGNLAFYDGRLLRTSLYRIDGTFLRSCPVPVGDARPYQIHPLSDGGMVVMHSHQVAAESFETDYWVDAVVFSAGGDSLSRIESPRMRMGRWFDQGGGGRGFTRIYFGPYSQLVFTPQEMLLSGCSDRSELRIYNLDGTLSRIMRFEFEEEPVLPEERSVILGRMDERIRTARTESLEEYYRNYRRLIEIPDVKSHWAYMIVDDTGHIWLQGHPDYLVEGSTVGERDCRMVSPEGEYLGDATWPFRSLKISRGCMLNAVEDEETGDIDYIIYKARSTVSGFRYP